MKVTADVIAVLDRCSTDGNALMLPPGQMSRSQYVAVNKVLEGAGGKWNRSAKAHLFPADAADVIDSIILTGEITTTRDMGYFPTPPTVVEQMITMADLGPSMTVLEPSAGEGAILGATAPRVAAVACVEIDEGRAEKLEASGLAIQVVCRDFLTVAPHPVYHRVLMNPPFAKQADVAHVTHALKFLRPGGLLVSVMTIGATERVNRAATEFRALVKARGGEFTRLPDGTFKAAGTGVKTVLARIPAGGAS